MAGRHRLRVPLWVKLARVGLAVSVVTAGFFLVVIWKKIPDPSYTSAAVAMPVIAHTPVVLAPTVTPTKVQKVAVPSSAPQPKKSSFGGVKPHVAVVGNFLKARFNLKTVGGVGPRPANPRSDHPKGLALDLVVPNHKTGALLNACAQRHADDWAITYTLWDVPDHRDHVHISFEPRGEVKNLTC